MSKHKIYILFIHFFMMVYNVNGQHDFCLPDKVEFSAEEELTYRVYYNWKFIWIPAGDVHFKISENVTSFKVEVKGKTFPSYNSFFEVDDYFRSVIDKKTLRPIEFIRKVNEGKYIRHDSIIFDLQNSKAIYYDLYRNKVPTVFQIEECLHDILSILYMLRTKRVQDFEQGSVFELPILFDNKIYNIEVETNYRQDIKKVKDLGKIKTFMLTPTLIAGTVFNKNAKMNVWISDDKNKIPLVIESPVSVGSVKASLINYRNIKYPLKTIDK